LAPSPDGRVPQEKGSFFSKKNPLNFLISLVFLLDEAPPSREQRGTAVREEDRLLLCLAAAAMLFTHIAFPVALNLVGFGENMWPL